MDGYMGGSMDAWMHGWMDGRTDGVDGNLSMTEEKKNSKTYNTNRKTHAAKAYHGSPEPKG